MRPTKRQRWASSHPKYHELRYDLRLLRSLTRTLSEIIEPLARCGTEVETDVDALSLQFHSYFMSILIVAGKG